MSDARAAFELWYVGHTFDKRPPEIERDSRGNYILMSARLAWQAYHAGWLDRVPNLGTDIPESGIDGLPPHSTVAHEPQRKEPSE